MFRAKRPACVSGPCGALARPRLPGPRDTAAARPPPLCAMASWLGLFGSVFELCEVVLPAAQEEVNYRRGEGLARELHREQVEQAERHQEVNLGVCQEQHAQNVQIAYALYEWQRDYDARMARKEVLHNRLFPAPLLVFRRRDRSHGALC